VKSLHNLKPSLNSFVFIFFGKLRCRNCAAQARHRTTTHFHDDEEQNEQALNLCFCTKPMLVTKYAQCPGARRLRKITGRRQDLKERKFVGIHRFTSNNHTFLLRYERNEIRSHLGSGSAPLQHCDVSYIPPFVHFLDCTFVAFVQPSLHCYVVIRSQSHQVQDLWVVTGVFLVLALWVMQHVFCRSSCCSESS